MFPYKRLYRYNEENMEERPYKERKYYVVLKPYIKWNTDDIPYFFISLLYEVRGTKFFLSKNSARTKNELHVDYTGPNF